MNLYPTTLMSTHSILNKFLAISDNDDNNKDNS